MKKSNVIKFFAILLLLMTFISCEKIKELTEKDISVKITETTPLIRLKSEGKEKEVIVISINTPETKDYIDNVRSVKIKKFTYQIVDFRNKKDLFEVKSRIYANGIELSIDKINLKKAFDNKISFEITNDEALKKLSALLKKGLDIPLFLEYTIGKYRSAEVAQFKVKLTIEGEVTVGL